MNQKKADGDGELIEQPISSLVARRRESK